MQRRKAKRTTNSDDEAADEGLILAASNFKPNLADPRFADMLTNQHFALDPTDPRCVNAAKGHFVLRSERGRCPRGACFEDLFEVMFPFPLH